jgi:hypothetical protein
MTEYLSTALHNGSLWVIVACVAMFVGGGVFLYSRAGSGINAHPYAKGGDGRAPGTDMPAEATGREEMQQVLRPRRRSR